MVRLSPVARPHGHEGTRPLSQLTDHELLALLRDGDGSAYEELWIRYVVVGRTVARRWSRRHADDILSEAFLDVYEQVAHRGAGPTASFGPYLFAVIRNKAARLHRADQAEQIGLPTELDPIDDSDPLVRVADQDSAARLLSAFRALPERWQRVLWLAEVERVGRQAIAEEMRLPPNAVSALKKRARRGLRAEWIRAHVSAELLGDPEHVARELLDAALGAQKADGRRILEHVGACPACAGVQTDLREAARDRRLSTLSLGSLAGLAVVLPASSSLWAAPVTATLAAGVGLLGSAAAVVGVIALGLGAIALSAFERSTEVPAAAAPLDRADDDRAGSPRQSDPELAAPGPSAPATLAPIREPVETEPDSIRIGIGSEGPTGFPERPTPTAPVVGGGSSATGPSDDPSAAPAPTVASTSTATTYLAPRLSGAADPGSEVFVAVDDAVYRAESEANGAWALDLRSVQLPAGAHRATVWSVADGRASRGAVLDFVVDDIVLDGFPDSYPSVTLGDSMGSGLRFTMTGAPNGEICVESDTGQSARVPLDAEGSATRVLRFYNYGIYLLRMSACADGFFGPDTSRVVAVTNGVFDPWVVDDVMWWDLSEE